MESILLPPNRPDTPVSFADYCAAEGFEALKRALRELAPLELQQLVIDSGLRGRGGAGFPTGKKWSFVPRDLPGPRYLICNSDEMEPGTYKDRVLLEHNPWLLVEGLILAAYVLGVHHAFIFIRRGYETPARNLRLALAEAERAGFLGDNILGSGFSLKIDLHVSAGRYICGEETALMNALEGRRANPRSKPPFPAVKGLWGGPTVVNNVETLSNIPSIVRKGPEWFRGLAVLPEAAGNKLFCFSGHVRNRVCVELPLGITLGEILDGPAGGMDSGRKFKACIPGGASTPFFTPQHLSVPMEFDSVAKAGSRLGTGAVIFFDERTCMVAATLNLVSFYARESCGWCTPCREGLPFVREVLTRIEHGKGEPEDIEILREHVKFLSFSFCPLAPGAMGPVDGLLRHFEEEIREHIAKRCCPFRK
jgi:NADH-quinone oxidoreductase subunit F